MASNNYVRQFCNRSASVRLCHGSCRMLRATCHMRHLARRNSNNICQAANKLTAIKVVISWQRPRILPDC